MRSKNVGICRLCLQARELCKSHIIPNFMYGDLKDEDNKFYVVNLKDLSSKLRDTGEFERLLCRDCEGIISRYETYAKAVIYGQKMPAGVAKNVSTNEHGVKLMTVTGIDYEKFKLFQLSLLWRSSVSKRDLFCQVDLGKYEEDIRQRLLSGQPGEASDYACSMMFMADETEVSAREVITEPMRVRDKNGYRYAFDIGGIMYYFYVSPDAKKDARLFVSAAIGKNGEMTMPYLPRKQADMLMRKLSSNRLTSI